jgi:hypothetical protein
VGPDVVPGKYRIRHFGSYKYIFGGIHPYQGTTDTFKVGPNRLNGHPYKYNLPKRLVLKQTSRLLTLFLLPYYLLRNTKIVILNRARPSPSKFLRFILDYLKILIHRRHSIVRHINKASLFLLILIYIIVVVIICIHSV